MSVSHLSQQAACQLIGEIFVYHMPFNQALGLELNRLENNYAELSFSNKAMLVGNVAQKILHGGVIASVLDVAAGVVCATSKLAQYTRIAEEELRQKLAKMGTIDLRVDYLRPGRGEHFIASSSLLRAGNKISVARVELHNNEGLHIASATATYLIG
ncbi:thioesterase family protein [Enterobacteriaceae bacterium LUAb1]